MDSGEPLTRRRFVGLTCGLAVSAILSACGSTSSAPSAQSGAGASAAKPAGSTSSSASAAALRKLVVASTSAAGTQTPLWLADNLKAWNTRGLQVERKRVAQEIGTKALINKDIDVLIQSPNATLSADLNGGTDLVYIASIFNFSQFALAAKPAFQSAADLKGKSIGNDAPGSAVDYQTQVMIRKLGLQPQDVQLPTLGGSDAIMAALLAGKIDAGTISVPQLFQAEASGFRLLANTFDIKYQNIGPVVSRARIDELAPSLLVLLLGIRDGIQAFNTQPDLAKKVIAENTQESNAAVLQKTYDFYVKTTHFPEDLEPTIEGFQSIIDFVAETSLPAARGAKAEQFIDRRILDRLPKS